MSVENVENKMGVLILNDLRLGRSQMSSRTDNVLAAKIRKLKWAIEKAEERGGVVLLTGKIFDKTNSFSDFSLAIQQDLIRHPLVYIMADHIGCLNDKSINEKSIAGVIKELYPSKVVFENPLIVKENLLLLPRINFVDLSSRHTIYGKAVVFDNAKKIRESSDKEEGVLIISTGKNAIARSTGGSMKSIDACFRITPQDPQPKAYWLDINASMHDIEIPHEGFVFSEEVVSEDEKRSAIRSEVELSISNEFDPRKRIKKGKGDDFANELEKIYMQSKVSKTSYDIIRRIGQIK